MAGLVDEDSDDDYSDDPIKLFDFEHDRVLFGSLLKENGDTQYDESHQWNYDNAHEKDDEVEQSSDNELDHFSVSDCLPLSVELVDCAKFPWYFRKYTQQIMSKLDICNLVSDSDEEMNAEQTNNNNDYCIISDDIIINNEFQKIHNNIVNDYQKKSPLKSIIPVVKRRRKRRQIPSPKLRAELQRAVSQKNVAKIDLKRNTGLIGIKITRTKVVKHDGQTKNLTFKEPKTNKIIVNEVVCAADKILSQCDTSLMPLTKNVVTQATLKTNKESILSSDFVNNKIQNNLYLSAGKVAANFIGYTVKPKKISNQNHHETNRSDKFKKHMKRQKPHSLSENSQKPSSLSTNSPNHLKNAKKSNKYKNDQVKALQKMVSELLELQHSKKGLADKDDETKTNDHENFTEIHHAEERQHPQSPILPCSIMTKKNKNISEMPLKDKTLDKTDKLNQLVNNFQVQNDSSDNKTNTLIVNDQTTVKSVQSSMDLKSYNCSNLTNEDKSENIVNNSNIKQVKETPSNNNNSQTSLPSDVNISQAISNIVFPSLKESHNVPNPVALHGISSPDKLSKTRPLITNENKTPSSNTVIVQNKSQDPTANKLEKPKMAGLPSCQGSGNHKNQTNNQPKSTLNIPVHNSQPTAIILRKNLSNNPQNVTQNSQSIHNSIKPQIFKPQFYQNRHDPNQHLLPNHVFNQQFIPNSANLISSNYKFDQPHKNKFHSQNNQYYTTCNGWPQSHFNIQSKNASGSRKACKILPYRSSMMTSQMSSKTLKPLVLNNERVAQNNMPKVTSSFNGGMNNGELRKIHIKPRPQQKDSSLYKHNNTPVNPVPESVSSKTKMLQVLETAAKNLKQKDNFDTEVIQKQVQVNSFKRPKIPSNLDIVLEVNERKQIAQQKGYSPPILPIPTYVTVMDQVGLELKKHNEQIKNTVPELNIGKNVVLRNVDTSCMRILNKQLPENTKKGPSKKISLEEYKKRTLQMNRKSDSTRKNIFGDKNNVKRNSNNKMRQPNVQNNVRENVDRFSTECDLGYDSDSTVVL